VLIDSVPINTLNRQCSSGLTAIAQVCPFYSSSFTFLLSPPIGSVPTGRLCLPATLRLCIATHPSHHPYLRDTLYAPHSLYQRLLSRPFPVVPPPTFHATYSCPRPHTFASLGARAGLIYRSPTRSKPVKSISESQPV
jgi:hypothetical protein